MLSFLLALVWVFPSPCGEKVFETAKGLSTAGFTAGFHPLAGKRYLKLPNQSQLQILLQQFPSPCGEKVFETPQLETLTLLGFQKRFANPPSDLQVGVGKS